MRARELSAGYGRTLFMDEGIERIHAETAALDVTQREGNPVGLEPLPYAGEVVLIDEGEVAVLERAVEVDGHYGEAFTVLGSVQLDRQSAVALVSEELEGNLSVVKYVSLHG